MQHALTEETTDIEIEVTPPVTVKRPAWTKITAPRPWCPKVVGEELIGYYAGRTLHNGRFGQYEAVMVAVPGVGMRMVTGVKALSAIDAGNVQLRTPLKFVFKGLRDVGRDHPMKDIEVYADAASLAPLTELPEIPS